MDKNSQSNDLNKYTEPKNGGPYDSVFVVDEHWATHHHFDLRIRRENYLASWALPKARFPEKTNEKLLLVQTPHHNLKWLTFHGRIPKDEYGGGVVKIWDKGPCRVYKWTDTIKVINFQGKQTKDFYAIVRFDEKNHFLIKMSPESAGHYLKRDQIVENEYIGEEVYDYE